MTLLPSPAPSGHPLPLAGEGWKRVLRQQFEHLRALRSVTV